MKNTFKIFGLMLLAGTLAFSSCKDDEETTPGVNPETGKTQFTITATSNNDAWGTVSGGGTYDTGAAVTLTATANAGYTFVNWNTGATNNPLVFAATENATYTANFAEQAGVSVTYGSTNWNAQYINGQYSPSQKAFIIATTQATDPQSYPKAYIGFQWEGDATTGSFNGTSTVNVEESTATKGNPYMWYFTSADNAMTLGGNPCGDWWDKTMTLNITAFDATALTISLVANATMGNLNQCISGTQWDNVETCDMTMQATNVNLTNAGKSLFVSKTAEKLAAL